MAKDFSMSVDLKKFNKDVETYLKKFNKGPLKSGLKKLASALLKEVIKRNPVKTGRSRAGWYTAANKLGVPAIKTGTKEEKEGEKQGDYKEKLTGNNQYIEIKNRVNYTVYLEFGHSKQRPSGMVRVSMQMISKKIKEKFEGRL